MEEISRAAVLKSYRAATPVPELSGKPYLWEEFVLQLGEGRVCAAVVDRSHYGQAPPRPMDLLAPVRRIVRSDARFHFAEANPTVERLVGAVSVRKLPA